MAHRCNGNEVCYWKESIFICNSRVLGYYNYRRYQKRLKSMTSLEYRKCLLESIA